MPGGRLTKEDRQQIEAGLTEGRRYSEIAGRLRRPGSTISREVARNGGRRRYRAEHAHQATRARARRRPTAPRSTEVDHADAATAEFVDRFADLMAQTGLSRMAARVFTCLFTTDSGTLTAADLVGRLRVSPASVSHAIAFLEELAMVQRVREPGQRRERYVVEDDVWLNTWRTSARRNTVWADAVNDGVAVFGRTTPTGRRLTEMGRFFDRLGEDMAGGPEELDDARTILAAVHQAGKSITEERIATALAWPKDRVRDALSAAIRRPELTDPFVIDTADSGYRIKINSERLSPTQQAALQRS